MEIVKISYDVFHNKVRTIDGKSKRQNTDDTETFNCTMLLYVYSIKFYGIRKSV